jgi:molecular chaperone GrpE (heat shock protein)
MELGVLMLVVVLQVALITVITVVLFRLNRRPQHPQHAAGSPAEVEAHTGEELFALDAPLWEIGDGQEAPGPVLARLAELGVGYRQATEDIRRYSNQREVQIQHWQRLCLDVVRRVLPVLENLKPYLADEDERVAEVAAIAYNRLMTELATVGVRPVAPQPGEVFDWKYHQLDEKSSGSPPYTIVEVVTPGYIFAPPISGAAEMVLSPAEVIARGVEEPAATLADPAEESAGAAAALDDEDGAELASITPRHVQAGTDDGDDAGYVLDEEDDEGGRVARFILDGDAELPEEIRSFMQRASVEDSPNGQDASPSDGGVFLARHVEELASDMPPSRDR